NDLVVFGRDGVAALLGYLREVGKMIALISGLLSSLIYSPGSSSRFGGGGGGGLPCCCCCCCCSSLSLSSAIDLSFPFPAVPSSLSGTLRYQRSSSGRQLFSSSRSALESSELSQGNGSRIFGRLLRTFRKLDYAVNNALGHLVHIPACSLRHGGNIALPEHSVNLA